LQHWRKKQIPNGWHKKYHPHTPWKLKIAPEKFTIPSSNHNISGPGVKMLNFWGVYPHDNFSLIEKHASENTLDLPEGDGHSALTVKPFSCPMS